MELIDKYIADKLTDQEQKELELWLNRSIAPTMVYLPGHGVIELKKKSKRGKKK